MKLDDACLVRHHDLVDVAEYLAFAALAVLVEGEVVGTEDHILSRNRYGLTVGGLEQVACREHEEARLSLSLCGKRYVNRHLVAVEVSVERGTYQRMELDGSALYEHRLERLDTQTVKGWRTVEHYGVTLDYDLESVPDVLLGSLDRLARGLDVLLCLCLNEALHYEGLEQLESHLLGQAALIDLQLRAYDDNRTSRVVDTLTEKVLTEASLLTLEHIGERLERAVVRACYGSAASAVVDKCVYGLLEHALLVADNDFGSVELEELLKTVVSVDNTTVEVVEVGGREAAAVELYHRADIGRNYRNYVEDHPLGTVARDAEALYYVESFENADSLLSRHALELLVELSRELFEVDLGEELLNGLSAHSGLEVVLVFLAHIVVLALGEHLILGEVAAVAGIRYDVLREVEHVLEHLRGNVKHKGDTRGCALEIPDVRYGRGKLDVTHALASYLGTGDLNAAAVADLTLEADSLVLTAVALPVLCRAEDPLAEQTLSLGLECAVVDGFGLGYLAV